MTRVSRTRSRTLAGSAVGTVVRTGFGDPLVTTVTSDPLGVEYTEDHVGTPWVDSPFYNERGMCPRVSLNGVRTQSGLTYTSNDVPMFGSPMLYMRSPFDYAFFTKSAIANSTLAAMALANANPNTPNTDIPVSVLELRELPSLLRDAAAINARVARPGSKGAKANLMAQFGVLPILSDVVKLFDFSRQVNARETYLRELASGSKRLKRKLTEESWVATVANLVPFHSLADNQSSTNKCTVTGSMTRSYWFTLEASLLDVLTERDLQDLPQQLVLGLNTVTAKQLYELTPWSWLVDWFSDTGDIVAAFRGGLRWQWRDLNVMYRTDYHMRCSFPSVRSGFTVTPILPQSHAVTKNRVQPTVSIFPTWRIPYLTASQWSILSSLLILRL